eukprot:GFUD01056899.1.p1 GENE.GFUD01056899.1~~GFUD01056899.1.p1  ORF type:complete len:243 (-),score=50.00 GFUD01056899.1:89-817(-)
MSNTAMLLTLPPEILSNILTFLSQCSVCHLEISSKKAGAAVLGTDFWRKKAVSLSKTSESDFARNLLVTIQEHDSVSPVIFKMIVRASSELDNMVDKLKGRMWNIRGDISMNALMLDHTDTEECKPCAESLYNIEWKLEIIPVTMELEMAELAKDFVDEGIADIKERFVHTMKGPEPREATLRKRCFEICRAFKSEVEIAVFCDVDDHNYPEGFIYKDGHKIWVGHIDYGESDDDDEEVFLM